MLAMKLDKEMVGKKHFQQNILKKYTLKCGGNDTVVKM